MIRVSLFDDDVVIGVEHGDGQVLAGDPTGLVYFDAIRDPVPSASDPDGPDWILADRLLAKWGGRILTADNDDPSDDVVVN